MSTADTAISDADATTTDTATDDAGTPTDGTGAAGRSGWPMTLVVGAGFLALSVLLWWNVWSDHPSVTTTCGCGDAARFLWFFEWPAYAITHGHSLFYSQALFHPVGINLLNDTSVLALGVVLTPVTLLFGPVASMNVALTLAPALSALAMYGLLRRWVRWTPAAVVGGLAFGFSPFLVTELALNQLNIAFLAVLPLVAMAVDELLVRQRRSPYTVGAGLGALLVLQFFVSTEVLVITLLFGAVSVALLAGFALLRRPSELSPRVGHAVRGMGTALGGSLVVLAYPLWFLLRGPAHLTGPIWSNGPIDQYGNSLTSFWRVGGLGAIGAQMLRYGGYQGPHLPGLGYLGAGVVVGAVAALCFWRHDRRLQFFGGLGLVAAVLSLGPGHGYWVPWQLIEKVPWLGDVVEIRFTIVLSFCAAVMVAVGIDNGRRWMVARERRPGRAAAGALLVAVAVFVPTLVALGPNLPLTARSVVLPHWYAEVGSQLPPGRVVLAYPSPISGLQSSEAWQAVNKMRYAQAGGGGPEGQITRAGDARAGFTVLFDASFSLAPPATPTPTNLAAIRSALTVWGVTTIVVPDQPELPIYVLGRGPAYAVGLFTAAMGRPPAYSHSAWVWSGVSMRGPAVPLTDARFAACTTGAVAESASPRAVPDCVLGTGG